MTPIKLPVTGMDNTFATVPDNDHLVKHQASTDYLHGDGLWPLFKDKMAKVEAGTGLNVLVWDYYALIDGFKVAYRAVKYLNWSQKQTVNVSSIVGQGDRWLALKPGVDNKGQKENKEGILFLTSIAPDQRGIIVANDGDAIPLAKLNIPAGTTQVTNNMIDNSCKKWLADIDKTIVGLQDYIDESVELSKREIYTYLLSQYKQEIINEIGAGDSAVIQDITNRISTLESQIADVNVSISTIRYDLQNFQTYINQKVSQLETKSEALESALNYTSQTVNELQGFYNELSDKVSQNSNDIVALFGKHDDLLNDMQRMYVDLKNYTDEKIVEAKAELYNQLINELTTTLRQEIAQGDQEVLAELNNKYNEIKADLNNIINEQWRQNGDITWLINQVNLAWTKIYSLEAYINDQISDLETKSINLQTLVNHLNDAIAETESWKYLINTRLSNIENDLIAKNVQLDNQLQRIIKLEEQAASKHGLFEKEILQNIAQLNFNIATLHQTAAQEMYKGWIDNLKDLSMIDWDASSQIKHNNQSTKIVLGSSVSPNSSSKIWTFDNYPNGTDVMDIPDFAESRSSNGWARTNGNFLDIYCTNFRLKDIVMGDNPEVSFTLKANAWPEMFAFHLIGVESLVYLRFDTGGWGGQRMGIFVQEGINERIIDGGGNVLHIWDSYRAFYRFMEAPRRVRWVINRDEKQFEIYIDDVLDAVVSYSDWLLDPNVNLPTTYKIGVPEYNGTGIDSGSFWSVADLSFASNTIIPFEEGTVVTNSKNYGIVPDYAFVTYKGEGISEVALSRNNGTDWLTINPNEPVSLASLPEGQDVKVKFLLEKEGNIEPYLDDYAVFVK